jgi:signal transduction histidine kinase
MESVLYGSSYMLSTFFELYIISKLVDIFLGTATKEKRVIVAAYMLRLVACTVQYAYMPHALLNMLVEVITLFIITLCYSGNIAKKIIAVILIYVCLFASEAVVAGVLELADIPLSERGHNGDAFSYIGISIALWIIYEIIHAFKNINTEIVLPKTFDIIIVLLSFIIFLMETVIFSQKDIMDSIKVISVICMLLILFLIIYLYDVISKYYVERIQSEVIEREKNYYLKQAELLEQSNEGIRALRHDMKNHLYALASMISDENEDAKKYIDNIAERFEKSEIYSSTGNVALDSVINYKLSQAGKRNIKIYSNITIPSNIQNGVEDLVTIIGNLLDNAIEASERVVENRYIAMKIQYKRGTMFIDVKNGYDGIVKQKNGNITTKKADKAFHGIGLKSVRSAVNNHDGTMKVDFDKKEFRVNVMLYL